MVNIIPPLDASCGKQLVPDMIIITSIAVQKGKKKSFRLPAGMAGGNCCWMHLADDNPPHLHSTSPAQCPWQSTMGPIPTTPPGVGRARANIGSATGSNETSHPRLNRANNSIWDTLSHRVSCTAAIFSRLKDFRAIFEKPAPFAS